MELLTLTEYNRKASLGNDYTFLKSIYPTWSKDLHAEGNTMDNDKLETIGINGIVMWYFQNACPLPITYSFKNINKFIENPYKITWYDFKNIYVLVNYINCNIQKLEKTDFSDKYKHEFLLAHSIRSKNKLPKDIKYYFSCNFSHYLIDLIGMEKLKVLLCNCMKFVTDFSYWFDKETLFDTFIHRNQVIKTWVIIFQKYKVITEKMSYNQHKDIFIIDEYVENVQQLIYSLIVYYNNNFMINNKNTIHINHKIIKILEKEELLQSCPLERFDQCNLFIK